MTESEQVAEALRLQVDGHSQRAIAKAVGKPRHWVRYRLAQPDAPPEAGIQQIDLALLVPSPHARAVEEPHVAALIESIRNIGLLEPVVVRRVAILRDGAAIGGFEILAGRHRVKAFHDLGRQSIPAIVREADDLSAELMLIDENLCRHDLSPAERAMAVKRRKKIYELQHPETKHGSIGNGRAKSRKLGDSSAKRFTKVTADATGISERAIQLDAARGKNLDEYTLKAVVGTSLDKGEELDALAKLPPARRESLIARARAGERITIKQAIKQEARSQREAELAVKIAAGNLTLPQGRYGVILADPEWKFKTMSPAGLDRSADNHYPTSETDEIAARPVRDIAADDCVLFLWATAPMLPDALRVMNAWGFAYSTHAIWDKVMPGTGYWFRNQHELVLIGTRGKIVAPSPGTQPPSIIQETRGEHSVKPQWLYELIERWFPNIPKIELNARRDRPGWKTWGADASAYDPSIGETPVADGAGTTVIREES